MADFLIEIGTEEIPARMICAATDELTRRLRDLISREKLATEAKLDAYSTPRRIAVLASGIAKSQADIEEQVMGPSTKVAFKDGQPTPAAQAFAKKVGLDLAHCQAVTTPKGEYLAATVKKKGRPASELFTELLPKEIAGVYWAKNMYWREGKPERFVRPVRWIVALLDDQVVPIEFGGVTAGRTSRGHRVLGAKSQFLVRHPQHAGPQIDHELMLSSPTAYPQVMVSGYVIPTYGERELRIRKALDAATRTIPGARWREDKDLLDTVINLTEFPSAIIGSFEREYLTLPEEVLVTVMRDHQKYFAVEDSNAKLAQHFLAVLNTQVDAEGSAIIRHGNERVLRARFNDARFFWETDQKNPLRDRVQMLKAVTFQKDLGSYFEKTERVANLATRISDWIASAGFAVDRAAVAEAAMLAKTDLTSELVKEFTELQGIVGGLYAGAQGFPDTVSRAIYDQYKPESTDDAIPGTLEGAVLAMADKADSIAGMFGLGMIPSGSKDPFALRRAGNGIIRISAEHNLPVKLADLMAEALGGYKDSEAEKKFKAESYGRDVTFFFRERLEFYLKEVLGFAYDVVNAVLAAGAENVPDAAARARAAAKVRTSEDFEAISVAFKRIKNILKQATEAGKWAAKIGRAEIDGQQEPSESALAKQANESGELVRSLTAARHYDEALGEIAKIRKPLDKFFDDVMVMVDDDKIRTRRLDLLNEILGGFTTIADFSEIVTEKK